MVANSWMQHPVGYTMNSHGEPQLSNVAALFTNPTFLWGYVHVILASLITGALVMLAVAAWHLRRQREVAAFHKAAQISVAVLLPSILLTMFVGSELGVVETKYQPMKIAAAEAQWENCQPCSFSLFQIGGGNNDKTPSQIIEIPKLLSVLATNSLERWRDRPQPAAARIRKEIRARQLRARRLHPVLVDAGHGLPGDADRAAGAVGRLAAAPRAASIARSGSCDCRSGPSSRPS